MIDEPPPPRVDGTIVFGVKEQLALDGRPSHPRATSSTNALEMLQVAFPERVSGTDGGPQLYPQP